MTGSSGFQVIGSAPENYERYNTVIMAPFVEALLARVAIAPGDAVLDVACGTGLATRPAAERAGVGGRVVGLDVNAGMLAYASALPAPTGASIEWREASALELPFPDGEFDTVICQQGVQFFPDLQRAAQEMSRVAKDGARAAVTFWASLDDQTYMRAQAEALQDILGEAHAPLRPAFRLAPNAMCEAFERAGMHDVTAEEVVATISLPPLDPYAAQQVSTLPVAPAFTALSEEERMGYVRRMEATLRERRTPEGRYDCTFAVRLVSATK